MFLTLDALKIISGQGMPSYRHHELGDLYVRLTVEFPNTIPVENIPLLEKALPARKAMPKFNKKIHIDEVVLSEPNERHAKNAATGEDEDMEDEDDDGRPGVQCAQRKSQSLFSSYHFIIILTLTIVQQSKNPKHHLSFFPTFIIRLQNRC